jgi:hypothetical protein
MAEIDDALPNNPPSDSEFVEQEVVTADEINDTESQSTDEVEVVATEDGGAEISFDPNAQEGFTNTKSF